jgi:hypothetical protein
MITFFKFWTWSWLWYRRLKKFQTLVMTEGRRKITSGLLNVCSFVKTPLTTRYFVSSKASYKQNFSFTAGCFSDFWVFENSSGYDVFFNNDSDTWCNILKDANVIHAIFLDSVCFLWWSIIYICVLSTWFASAKDRTFLNLPLKHYCAPNVDL